MHGDARLADARDCIGVQAAGVFRAVTHQNNRADRRMTPGALRVQRRRRQDLLAQIDRGVEQQPIGSINGERDADLRARLHPLVAAPGELADAAAAVPLRHAAASA